MPLFAGVLADHHRILLEVWTGHRGFEVSTEGDAFFVVFPDPDDAVGAALAAHRALRAHDWPADIVVRVRIGLHTGTAEIAGDNYVGIEVHRAARIAAAAHGGQVLMSARTASSVTAKGWSTINATSIELGRYRLKDFDEPESLLEVRRTGDATSFPAPRVAPAAAHNLPQLRTSFIGREFELAEIGKRIGESRLVTLLGPGGAGKTRLALESARRYIAQVRDGVWAVLLAGARDERDFVAAVAASLGVADVVGQSLLAGIVESCVRGHCCSCSTTASR